MKSRLRDRHVRRWLYAMTALFAVSVGASVMSVQSATATPGLYSARSTDGGVPSAWTEKLTWKVPASGIWSVCLSGRFNETTAKATGIRVGLKMGDTNVAALVTETQRPNPGVTFMSACTNVDLDAGSVLTFQAQQQGLTFPLPRTRVEYDIVRVA